MQPSARWCAACGFHSNRNWIITMNTIVRNKFDKSSFISAEIIYEAVTQTIRTKETLREIERRRECTTIRSSIVSSYTVASSNIRLLLSHLNGMWEKYVFFIRTCWTVFTAQQQPALVRCEHIKWQYLFEQNKTKEKKKKRKIWVFRAVPWTSKTNLWRLCVHSAFAHALTLTMSIPPNKFISGFSILHLWPIYFYYSYYLFFSLNFFYFTTRPFSMLMICCVAVHVHVPNIYCT